MVPSKEERTEESETEETLVEDIKSNESTEDLRKKIKEYEDQIKSIERGEKLRVKTKDSEALGTEKFDSIDDLHKKIVDTEDELRNLEKQEKENKETSEGVENNEYDLEMIEKVSKCKDIVELLELVGKIDFIPSQSIKNGFSGLGLRNLILLAWEEKLDTKYVTRTWGIRAKLESLLEKYESELKSLKEKKEEDEEDDGKPKPPPLPDPEPTLKPVTPPPLPWERENEEIVLTESVEEILLNLDAMRMRYLVENKKYIDSRKEKGLMGKLWQKLRGIKPQEKTERPPELDEAKEKYDAAKVELGRFMMDRRRELLEAQHHPNVEEELQKFKATEVFQRIVLDEYALLEKFNSEKWPPKEQNIMMKSLKWYARQPKSVKLATGAMIAGGGALAGGLAWPTAAVFAGAAVARGAISMGAGLLSGKGFDYFKPDKSNEKLQDRVRQMSEAFSKDYLDVKESDDLYRSSVEVRDKEKGRHNLQKGTVIFLVSMLTSFGLGKLSESIAATQASNVPESTENPDGGTPLEYQPTTPEATTNVTPSSGGEVPRPLPVAPEVVNPGLEAEAIAEPDLTGTVILTPEGTGPFVSEDDFGLVDVGAEIIPQSIIVGGENPDLWHAVRNSFEEYDNGFNSMSVGEQNNAIDTVYQRFLDMSPDQLREIGISSGNPHMLYDGELVNISGVVNPESLNEGLLSAGQLSAEQTVNISQDALDIIKASASYTGQINEDWVNGVLENSRASR